MKTKKQKKERERKMREN